MPTTALYAALALAVYIILLLLFVTIGTIIEEYWPRAD